MRDVLEDLGRWWAPGEAAIATVVGTWRSAPRPAGATMLVGPEAPPSAASGRTGGETVPLATEDDVGSGVRYYSVQRVSDNNAFVVSLTCGGIINVYVERIDPHTFPEFSRVADAIRSSTPVAGCNCVLAAARASTVVAPGAPP